jgi:hypothetical protein
MPPFEQLPDQESRIVLRGHYAVLEREIHMRIVKGYNIPDMLKDASGLNLLRNSLLFAMKKALLK